MKVLVTGANGFIGKNLITRLLENKNVEYSDYHMPIPYNQYKEVIEKIYKLSVQNGFI